MEKQIFKRQREGDREGYWQQLADKDASCESLHLNADGWSQEMVGVYPLHHKETSIFLHYFMQQWVHSLVQLSTFGHKNVISQMTLLHC